MGSNCFSNSSNAAVCGAYARYNRFISKVLWMKHLIAVHDINVGDEITMTYANPEEYKNFDTQE
jgi:hypothetical protein